MTKDFFTDPSNYTHVGSFYHIPVYLDLTDEIPTITGTNRLFTLLFSIVSRIHNEFIETPSTFLAYGFAIGYSPCFQFHIKGELVKQSPTES